MLNKSILSPLLILICLVFSLGLSRCQSSNPKSGSKNERRQSYKGDQARLLISVGSSREGSFSAGGEQILFHAYNRPEHKHSQVYLLDLKSGQERRITYQDGETSGAIFTDVPQEIIYASTTDEIKENPPLIQSIIQEPQPSLSGTDTPFFLPLETFELYKSSINGRNIDRLTRSRGYDASAALAETPGEIVHSSYQNRKTHLFRLQLKSRRARRLTSGDHHDFGAVYSSALKKWVWSRFNQDLSIAQLYTSDSSFRLPKALDVSPAQLPWSPTFHPERPWILFSAMKPGTSEFDIYIYDLESECMESVTETPGHEYFPRLHPDGKQLLFTRRQGEVEQLYLLDFRPEDYCASAKN